MAVSRRHLLFTVVAVACLAGGLLWWFTTRHTVETDDAFVDGDIYFITPRVGGYVADVPAEDNQAVAAGQPLVVIDPTDSEVRLAQAKADLSQAQARLAALELAVPLETDQTRFKVDSGQADLDRLSKEYQRAQAERDAATKALARVSADLQQARVDMGRMAALYAKGAISTEERDRAATRLRALEAEADRAGAMIRSAESAAAAVDKGMGTARAQIHLAATGKDVAGIRAKEAAAQRALVSLSEARVRQAELDLSYTRILAPVAGYVTRKAITEGQMVFAGQRLMAVVPLEPEKLWITANFKETQVTRMRPGQPVDIRVDSYGGLRLKGQVESVMAGTGAAFSLFPPENAAGNFVKVVQRIPVRIRLEPVKDAKLPPLRVGMSVVPKVDVSGQ